MYLRPFDGLDYVPYFHPLSDRCSRAMARRRGTTRPKAMARLQQLFIRCHAIRQMNEPQWCQDTCLLLFAEVLMLSSWPCRRLNVAWQQQPPPPPLWARAAHPGPQVGFHCFLFLLVGVVLNRRLQIAGFGASVAAIGARRLWPVTVWVFSSLAAVGEPSCH